MSCIFCKIVDKSVAANIVYEDDDLVSFHDNNPKAPVHLLLIPKLHIASTLDIDDSHINLLGKMFVVANKIAKMHNLTLGYKLHINTGASGGQEVYHVHLHIYGVPHNV
jgi:histidine triad (HIT) family protein